MLRGGFPALLVSRRRPHLIEMALNCRASRNAGYNLRNRARMLCRKLTTLRTVASYFFGSAKTVYEFITGGAPAGSRAVGTSHRSTAPCLCPDRRREVSLLKRVCLAGGFIYKRS